MFKHTVEYNDFNGNERTEDLYFHLATHEVTRLEASIGMSLEDHITELQTNQKVPELLAFLEKVMINAFGVKSADGKTFRKTKEIHEEFEYSQAYAELFEQVVTNPDLARKFGEGVAEKAGNKKKNTVDPKVVSPTPGVRSFPKPEPTQE